MLNSTLEFGQVTESQMFSSQSVISSKTAALIGSSALSKIETPAYDRRPCFLKAVLSPVNFLARPETCLRTRSPVLEWDHLAIENTQRSCEFLLFIILTELIATSDMFLGVLHFVHQAKKSTT